MIFINEIIILKEQGGVPVVSSREIAERFGKDHAKVLRTISDKLEVNPILASPNYFIENTYVDKSNRQSKEYLMARDGFSFLVMGFTGREADGCKLKYIEAFNKMETALKEQNTTLPTTYKAALIQLLDQVEKNEILIEENKVLLPKAEYHDDVLNKTKLITTTIVAKDLGFTSATKLNATMLLNKIIYKNANGVWTPYATYEWLIKDGYADYRSYTQDNANPSLQWTEKGRKWIVENYKDWNKQ